MVFSSIIFLYLYLPIVLLGYLLVARRLRNCFLLLASLVFYFWGENYLILILLVTIVTDFTCGWLIAGQAAREGRVLAPGPRTRQQKLILVFSIMVNLGLLGYFKYCNFFLDNVMTFTNAMGWGSSGLLMFGKVALPLGISFYTFQSMSYTIDVYRGEVRATRRLLDFACYVTMFPQLVAGPIVRYRDLQDQLLNHELSIDKFSIGVRRFVFGLAKKVLIANTVAQVADAVFAVAPADLHCGIAWLGIICYSLQIYYDFSGYSDMAIGLGLMFGFRFPENFNYPYAATSIREFWQRWHISLSTWFRDYLYIPLGGSRGSLPRTGFNLLTVFLLCGFWHGASWNFLVWGLWHGAFLFLERMGLGSVLTRLPRICRHFYMLLTVTSGWVFFRSGSLDGAWHFLGVMFGLAAPAANPAATPFAMLAYPSLLTALGCGIVFAAPLLPWWLARYHTMRAAWLAAGTRVGRLWVGGAESCGIAVIFLLLTASGMLLATGSYNPFIYFRF